MVSIHAGHGRSKASTGASLRSPSGIESKIAENARPSVRRQRRRPGLGMNFGRHHALGTRPEPDQNILTRPELGHAETAQRLHVDENVGRPLPASQETETAQPVEPLDLGALKPAG